MPELDIWQWIDYLREQHYNIMQNPRFWYDSSLRQQSFRLVSEASDLQLSMQIKSN